MHWKLLLFIAPTTKWFCRRETAASCWQTTGNERMFAVGNKQKTLLTVLAAKHFANIMLAKCCARKVHGISYILQPRINLALKPLWVHSEVLSMEQRLLVVMSTLGLYQKSQSYHESPACGGWCNCNQDTAYQIFLPETVFASCVICSKLSGKALTKRQQK